MPPTAVALDGLAALLELFEAGPEFSAPLLGCAVHRLALV